MTKTIHPLLSKLGRGEGAIIQGKALFKILADRRGTYLKGALPPGEHRVKDLRKVQITPQIAIRSLKHVHLSIVQNASLELDKVWHIQNLFIPYQH